MDDERIRERLYDLPRLLELRDAVRRVQASSEPRAEVVVPLGSRSVRLLGVLPGSFNPLTVAHTELAAAALGSGGVDGVLFALSTHTVDKEVITGAALEDRLLVLELATQRDEQLGVLLVNRGLYVEQAELVRAALPKVDELVFLVGHDKIVQILDPRYYDDRDAALARLFAAARFLVAPRGADDAAVLAALLGRSENRAFAEAIRSLDLPPALREVASSRIRQGLSSRATVGDHLPAVTRVFADETGAYEARPPDQAGLDRYRLRLSLLDALEVTRGGAASAVDFRGLFARAVAEYR